MHAAENLQSSCTNILQIASYPTKAWKRVEEELGPTIVSGGQILFGPSIYRLQYVARYDVSNRAEGPVHQG